MKLTFVLLFTIILEFSTYCQENLQADSIGEIFTFVEKMPEFPGGDNARIKFINKNLKYPKLAKENNIEGMILAQFIVDTTGQIVLPRITRSISPLLSDEVLRVIKLMPKWIPGRHNGKPVNVSFVLPINFKLEDRKWKNNFR